MTITPATCLRLAEALPSDTAEWPIIRELVAALKDLVTIADKEQS